jgi:hypothetical protein
MTEQEWLASNSPGALMRLVSLGFFGVVDVAAPEIDRETLRTYADGLRTSRKRRLFGCACCRRLWPLLSDQRVRAALETEERFLEGQATGDEVKAAHRALSDVQRQLSDQIGPDEFRPPSARMDPAARTHFDVAEALLSCGPNTVVRDEVAAAAVRGGVSATVEEEWGAQAALVRDIFGNPFRPVAVAPGWLAWSGGTVARLAQAAHDERRLPSGHLDPGRLAVLADALEDAGCADEAILSHLRGLAPHVRGCWAVDLILGKT